MEAKADPARGPAVAMLVILGAAGAALLAWLSVGVNISRACVTNDTPYLELCPRPKPGSAGHLEALRSRIAANPGDANAYVQLAAAESPAGRARVLGAARHVTPASPTVVALEANAALERQDWGKAVALLVELAEHHDNPQATLILARLVGSGNGQWLSPYLKPGSRWFARVLPRMPEAKAAFSTALPLVAQAHQAGVLDTVTVRAYVRQLKTSGAWADAYSLWLSLHGKPLPVLYNGGFDEAFQPDGFDWEVAASEPASKTGAFVDQREAEQRGAVLDIRFTGRAIAVPLVRQYLFINEGRYRLRGDYRARQLRMEEGLAWTLRCSSPGFEVSRSSALADTRGAWQPFAFEFSVPAGCGLVASLQLEPYAAFEAALGARGQVAFDGFSLEKVGR